MNLNIKKSNKREFIPSIPNNLSILFQHSYPMTRYIHLLMKPPHLSLQQANKPIFINNRINTFTLVNRLLITNLSHYFINISELLSPFICLCLFVWPNKWFILLYKSSLQFHVDELIFEGKDLRDFVLFRDYWLVILLFGREVGETVFYWEFGVVD